MKTDRCATCGETVELVTDIADPFWRHRGATTHPARPRRVLKERLFAAYDRDPSMSYAETVARKAWAGQVGPNHPDIRADIKRYGITAAANT